MHKNNYLIKLTIINILVVFILDQISKYIIYITYVPYQTKVIIPGFFNIVFAQNTGAAFSLLADAAPWFRTPFFIIVPLVAMTIIFILLKKSSKEQIVTKEKKLEIISFSLILGGAFGNFIDRLHYGYVIDFLQFHYQNNYWPSFNVADIAISIAIGLLFISMILADRNKKRINKDESGRRI